MFWLMDQASPSHFSLTAQITGGFSVEQLRQALDRLQQRHPLLQVGIGLDAQQRPCFFPDSTPIPLRVVQRRGEFHWSQEVEREMATPFSWAEAPLIRVVLVYSPEIAELIVTCHHAIADGMSVLFLIRDCLQAIATPHYPLPCLPESPPLEVLIPPKAPNPLSLLLFRTLIQLQGMGEKPQARAVAQAKPYCPRLLAGSLVPEATTSLIACCRKQNTSVHAAISAAFLLAIAQLQSSPASTTLKCLSPIDLRRYLSPLLAEQCGLYIFVGLTAHTLDPNADLWEVARSLKQQLQHQATPNEIAAGIARRQTWMALSPKPRQVLQGFSERAGYDLMVTNLGRLPFDQRFEHLRLQAIYGPTVMSGVPNDRVVGVATVGDRLCYTLLYPESVMSTATAKALQNEATAQLHRAIAVPSPAGVPA